MTAEDHDAIVVGGGHNGLVAAAYLARAGCARSCWRPAPPRVGAAVTETPWGPDFKVTALSYVMSLMPPTSSPTCDWRSTATRSCRWGRASSPSRTAGTSSPTTTPRATSPRSPSSPPATPQRLADYEAWLRGVADVLSPLLLRTPPRRVAPARRPARPAAHGLGAARPRRAQRGRGDAAVHDVDRRRPRPVVRVTGGQGRPGDQRGHRNVGRARRSRAPRT